MPSIRMITAGAPGADQFGAIPNGDVGFAAATRLDSWSPEALAPHVSGYYQAQAHASAAHRHRVNEAARLLADVVQGRVEPIFLREAMCPRNPVLVEHLRQMYPGLYKVNGRVLGLRETM